MLFAYSLHDVTGGGQQLVDSRKVGARSVLTSIGEGPYSSARMKNRRVAARSWLCSINAWCPNLALAPAAPSSPEPPRSRHHTRTLLQHLIVVAARVSRFANGSGYDYPTARSRLRRGQRRRPHLRHSGPGLIQLMCGVRGGPAGRRARRLVAYDAITCVNKLSSVRVRQCLALEVCSCCVIVRRA